MNSLLFSPTTSLGGIRVRTLSPPPPPPMFAMGSPLFDDLESVTDKMFSSSLQIFDEAFSEALNAQKVAEERAMEAFDKKLPSLVDEIASSISSSSSSSSSSSDYPASEDERDVTTQQEEVFAGVLGELADFSRHLQLMESRRRRRLSEIDPHTQMRNRLARRLTEYVSTTEVFQLPGGGVMRVVRVNPVEEENPRLGFMFREMDDCVYSRYQNGDLSDNCNQAVSSLMDFVAARRSNHLQQQRAVALPPLALNQEQVKEEQQAWKPPHVLLSQKAGQTYRRVVNGDDATLRYMAFGWILASAALTIALCVLAAKNIWALTACVALILSSVFVGPFSMLAMLTVIIVWCRVYQEFFEEDDEEDDNAVTFDYVKMEEEEDDDKEPNSDTAQTLNKPQVFVGVPVQVV